MKFKIRDLDSEVKKGICERLGLDPNDIKGCSISVEKCVRVSERRAGLHRFKELFSLFKEITPLFKDLDDELVHQLKLSVELIVNPDNLKADEFVSESMFSVWSYPISIISAIELSKEKEEKLRKCVKRIEEIVGNLKTEGNLNEEEKSDIINYFNDCLDKPFHDALFYDFLDKNLETTSYWLTKFLKRGLEKTETDN
jgi:hypothetical protein